MFFAAKVLISAFVIAFASWLAGKRPELAGFITALPLVTILALAFSHIEHKDLETSATYARSILLAVPVSWLFFVPFFLTGKIDASFWAFYIAGLVLLAGGFFLHQYLARHWL